MKCPQCKNNVKFIVNVIFSGPMEFWRNLSKTALRQKDMKLLGVDWEKATIICWNCGYRVQDAD